MSRFAGVVLLLLLGCGCQQFRGVTEFGRNLSDYFAGNTPLQAVAKMEDRYFPDERRQGINRLVNRKFGRRAPYTERYMQIAQYDSDWLVRATAIRALNRSRWEPATPVFIKALDDPSPLVRQEAAKALSNIPDPNAIASLTRLVSNTQESRDVRIAAADALRNYRTLEVGRALASTLGAKDFGVAWQARRSLISMTGQNLSFNESEWLQYLTSAQKPFT